MLPRYADPAYHFRSLQLRPDITVGKMMATHLYPQSCTFNFIHARQRLHCEAELGMGVPHQQVGCSDLVSAGAVQCSHSARKVISLLQV